VVKENRLQGVVLTIGFLHYILWTAIKKLAMSEQYYEDYEDYLKELEDTEDRIAALDRVVGKPFFQAGGYFCQLEAGEAPQRIDEAAPRVLLNNPVLIQAQLIVGIAHEGKVMSFSGERFKFQDGVWIPMARLKFEQPSYIES
jgi:hypothetical protein